MNTDKKTVITAIAANISFIAGYVFYLLRVFSAGLPAVPAAVYIAPAAVYTLLAACVFMGSKAADRKMREVFIRLSPALFIFMALFLTPLFVRMNLPSPHNFLQRKLELMFGICYAVYIFAVAGLLIRIAAAGGFAERAGAKKMFFAILTFFFIFYFFLSLWFHYANEPTGDEPAYIIAAVSMLSDHDIDMRNNYANGDYKSFYSRELKPQGDDLNVNGKMYPKHPLMVSLIIAPFYLLAGVAGISALMCFFSALLAALMFYLNYRIYSDMKASVIAAILAGSTMPALMFINLAGSDTICAVILTASYILYRFKPEKVALFSLIMATAVWIHIRTAPLYAAIALLFLIRHRNKPAAALKFSIIQALSFAAFFGINLFLYKDLIPYSSHQTQGLQFGAYVLKGLFVYFFDRQLGLFSYAPFYILFIPGLYFLYRKSKPVLAEFAAIFIPYYLMTAAYPYWGWGSSSPRYLMGVIFILAASAAGAISALRGAMARNIFYALSGLSLCISLAVGAIPWFRWDRTGHENWIIYIFSQFTKTDVSWLFPSIINMSAGTVYALAFWVALSAAITLAVISGKNNK